MDPWTIKIKSFGSPVHKNDNIIVSFYSGFLMYGQACETYYLGHFRWHFHKYINEMKLVNFIQ